MNQVPFLDELKRELLEHAPQPTDRGLPVRRRGIRLSGVWVAAVVFVATLVLGGVTWLLAGSALLPSANAPVLLETFNVGDVVYQFRTYTNQQGPDAPCVGVEFDLDTGGRRATMACPTQNSEEAEYAAFLEASAWTFVVGYGLQPEEEIEIEDAVRVITTEEINGRRFFLIQFAQPPDLESFEVPVRSPDGTLRSIPTVSDPAIEEPEPVEPGPELEWRQVDTPGEIDRVRNLWTTSTRQFAIWTGTEIWVSSDGETWEVAASNPPIVDNNQVQAAAATVDGWILAGKADDGAPIVAHTSDGTNWTTSALPASSPINEMLTSSTEVVAVTSGQEGSVAVGAVTTGVNEEAVIARFAPDLTDGGEIRYQDDSVEILASDGTVRIEVSFSEIDERFDEQRGVILDTVIWQSPDDESWEQVELIEGSGPGFLTADTNLYYLTLEDRFSGGSRILRSTNGIEWTELTTSEASASGTPLALFEGNLVVAGPDGTVQRIQPNGATAIISTGAAFDAADMADLTIAQVAAGEYGLVTAAYDHTRGTVPYVALWYSPDGQQWSGQATDEIFGSEGNLLVAVGEDRVVVANDPQGEGGLALQDPLQIWLGSLSN